MSDPPSRLQGLLADLKRRNVFRVVAIYGATAFVVLQVADLVFPRLGLPDWTVTLVVALVLVGLPLAIAIAWAFESAPGGLRRTPPATTAELAEIVARPRVRRWPAGVAALLGVLMLGAGASLVLGLVDSPRHTSYDSIAVLPFANLSGDPDNEFFGDGLAEELLNALAGIDGLKVAARTSAFAFKDRRADVRTIGDTLGVATVLEGSVRRSKERIRITVQLVDADTGYRLWTDTYDEPLADLFSVQQRIADEIVGALSAQFSDATGEELYRGGTRDVEAYDLYLTGRQKWATRQMPLLREAVHHFEQAIARDSSFALAWSGLADALDALAWRRDSTALSRIDDAKQAAQHAILLDPNLGEGWASLGVLLTEFDRDMRFAELALRRAVELKPSYASAQLWLSNAILYSGRPRDALESARRAIELDPLSGVGKSSLALTLFSLGQWEEARQAYERFRDAGYASQTTPALKLVTGAAAFDYTADVAGENARAWAVLSNYEAPDEAEFIGRAMLLPEHREAARVVLLDMANRGLRPRDLAELHVALGDVDRAMDLLEVAFAEHDPYLLHLGIDPTFDALRDEPRFIRLLQSLGVPNGVTAE